MLGDVKAFIKNNEYKGIKRGGIKQFNVNGRPKKSSSVITRIVNVGIIPTKRYIRAKNRIGKHKY